MRPRPNTARRQRQAPQRPARRFSTPGFWAGLAIVILLVAYVQVTVASQPHPTGQRVDFSSFVSLAEQGAVKNAIIRDQDSYVEGSYQRRGGKLSRFNTPFLRGELARVRLVEVLQANQVPLKVDQQIGKSTLPLLSFLLPSLMTLVAFGYFIIAIRTGTGPFAQRSASRRATDEETTLRFDDVAAQDTAVAELRELAQFLIDPERFTKLGARIPKGVLLYGPPGCGKTLLASAVAGEAGAAFYSISGSDFVEMYQGVGAARVRELFREARENAPSIIFIDEIDAVAKKRQSATAGESNEEQGQALNQLLTEMDGFGRAQGTIVIGATNRPDDLDGALLRPGRFDRTVSVDRPDEAGRTAILALHAQSKPLADAVDLGAIARRAIGFTGADLESVTNEAALLAARSGRSEISQPELDEALTRILEAPERQRRLSMRDRTMGQQSLSTERVTFAQVAGIGEALTELSEIRDFLNDPSRFSEMGARFPRGFLLVGPPGCGKTLLARAVAGESNAAFLSAAATEFTEIYVGEGSGRVRDLFSQARAMAPAIVFIDEIDAIGARRESSADGNREREQTLNQILVELDGFRQRDGVIVMAATNRPEILDPALVRAGRFDREITVDLPDRTGRRDILNVHIGTKRLAADVDLDAIAGITRGLSGADLANVMNEAALLSARRGQSEISMATVGEAVERSTIGISRAHVLSDSERRVIAVHEAGHVVVALAMPEGRLPHMVSIIPSGRSLGRAWLTDSHDRVVRSRSAMIDEMAILLGGRGAEELALGQIGSTAAGDLAKVGHIAHEMVREMGMSDAFISIGYAEDPDENGHVVSYSEDTARRIDAEAHALVTQAQERADEALRASRGALDRIAEALLENETLGADQIEQLVGRPTATLTSTATLT